MDTMTTRPRSRRTAGVAGLALATALTASACGDDRAPRRVPDDGAPCSAVMPGAPEMGQVTYRLGSVNVSERGWGVQPPSARNVSGDANGAVPTRYFLRRATLPTGSPVRDEALLEAAGARVGKGIALQDGTRPTVTPVQTGAGQAIELRWTAGKARNATRVLLTPTGYCEATILGAGSDADIASYFASVETGAPSPR
jgi:hypothetical protein